MTPEQLSAWANVPERISVADIQAAVAEHYGVPLRLMTARDNHRDVARPRQVGMFLARELTHHSLPNIGRMFGGRDHTTVLYATRMVELRAIVTDEVAADLKALRAKIRAEKSVEVCGAECRSQPSFAAEREA